MSIRPFRVNISAEKIRHLKRVLAQSKWPTIASMLNNPRELRDDVLTIAKLKHLVSYWQDEYDWRDVEAEINEIPQYMTSIDIDETNKCDIHFIHQTSNIKFAIPLLFLHDWPGSFLEVTKILPELVKEGGLTHPSFNVVAPSLVDFGFSSSDCKEGIDVGVHAEVYHDLMQRLGYNEYVVQGGGIGALIARFIALKFGPDYCKAIHINSTFFAASNGSTTFSSNTHGRPPGLAAFELSRLPCTATDFREEFRFFHLHAKDRFHTLGYSMSDSPVALLCWLYEKMRSWSHEYVWTDKEICTWVSIYYFSTAGPEASSRIFEAMDRMRPVPACIVAQEYIDVPLGVTRSLNDAVVMPREWYRVLGPLVFERDDYRHGHFPAWECPDSVVGDLRSMFGVGNHTFGCVS